MQPGGICSGSSYLHLCGPALGYWQKCLLFEDSLGLVYFWIYGPPQTCSAYRLFCEELCHVCCSCCEKSRGPLMSWSACWMLAVGTLLLLLSFLPGSIIAATSLGTGLWGKGRAEAITMATRGSQCITPKTCQLWVDRKKKKARIRKHIKRKNSDINIYFGMFRMLE